jgi:hypothetical protein
MPCAVAERIALLREMEPEEIAKMHTLQGVN